MAEATGATFTILSDEEGLLLDYFDVWHRNGSRKFGDISIASSFLFTRRGKLIWHNITDNYKIRPKVAVVLQAARAFSAAAPRR